jgi:predicted hydrocarbon binding protein
MHGLIANQLRQFVVERQGRAAWVRALERSGAALPEGPPPLDGTYSDSDVVAVVSALADAASTNVADVLAQFGEYLAGALLRVYGPLVLPEWRTLDVIQHAEERIHTAVRLRDPNAGPPYLSAERLSRTEVAIAYTSPRRLCALAEGITRGLAAHFEESVEVAQPECMLRGDARCLITVRLVTHAPA